MTREGVFSERPEVGLSSIFGIHVKTKNLRTSNALACSASYL